MAKLNLSFELLKERMESKANDEWEDLGYEAGTKTSAFKNI